MNTPWWQFLVMLWVCRLTLINVDNQRANTRLTIGKRVKRVTDKKHPHTTEFLRYAVFGFLYTHTNLRYMEPPLWAASRLSAHTAIQRLCIMLFPTLPGVGEAISFFTCLCLTTWSSCWVVVVVGGRGRQCPWAPPHRHRRRQPHWSTLPSSHSRPEGKNHSIKEIRNQSINQAR